MTQALIINYSENGAENLNAKTLSAALFWVAAKKRRRPPCQNTKIAAIANQSVRLDKLVAPRGFEPRPLA